MSLLLLLTNPAQVVQTTFLEPGGDADFAVTTTNGFWTSIGGAPSVATDFVHGSHLRSIKHRTNFSDWVVVPNGTFTDSGTRFSFYVYINALPASSSNIYEVLTTGEAAYVFSLRITSGGVLQLADTVVTQIGSNGATLSTGQWYRISLAYKITSTSVNRFELFVDGVSSISVTNATLTRTGSSTFRCGNPSGGTLDVRNSDFYIDNSVSLTDTGNIWVTAKRPNSNGTTNGFTTQIGVGGSGYGSGHSPQVNERALSTTNGWSMIGAGSAITEQYNIEGQATGDTNISTSTIVDYMGWVSAMALVAAGANIIVNGVSTAISLTTSAKVFTKIAGSTSYPSGTGADIGIITDTTLTTVSLYEAGVIVAYIPGAAGGNNNQRFMLMGVG